MCCVVFVVHLWHALYVCVVWYLFQPFGQSLHGLLAVVAVTKGRETDIALATWTEAHTGCAHHMGIVEQLLKEAPTARTIGRLHPEIGGILSAKHLYAQRGECIAHHGGVGHVVIYHLFHLLLALGRIGGLGCLLADIDCFIRS